MSSATHEIRNPGPHSVPKEVRLLFVAFVVVGIVCWFLLKSSDHARAWSIFLTNHFYFLTLGLGGVFFAAVQWMTSSMWSAPVRRVSESFSAYLPIAAVTTVIVFFGIHDLYHWSHADAVAEDPILQAKAGYLNSPFFIARNVIAVLLWLFFAWKLIKNSIQQDKGQDVVGINSRQKVLSPVFLMVFGITFTMASFDLVMSLNPHWFSTIFGLYCFAGMLQANFSLTCLITIYLKRKGLLSGVVNDNHLHDLGKFMFAFTVFWAYIGFSQFMLIWYANIPEETMYYVDRFESDWLYVAFVLFFAKFIVPFFALIQRDSKRNEGRLIFVGIWILVCQWIDTLWMVQAELVKSGPSLGLTEIFVTLGFVGLFGLAVSWFLGRFNVLAIGDPRLEESAFHHHQ